MLRLSELRSLVQFAQTRSDNPRCSHHKEKEIPTGPAKKVEIFWTKTGLMRLKCFGLNAPEPLPLVSPTFGSNAHSLFLSIKREMLRNMCAALDICLPEKATHYYHGLHSIHDNLYVARQI